MNRWPRPSWPRWIWPTSAAPPTGGSSRRPGRYCGRPHRWTPSPCGTSWGRNRRSTWCS
nr:MAG TPA: hypothetical protein [Caudoviricetes sp.]